MELPENGLAGRAKELVKRQRPRTGSVGIAPHHESCLCAFIFRGYA